MSEEPNNSGDQLEAAAPVSNVNAEPGMAEAPNEPQMVPLDALQAERAERQRVQDDLKMMKDHMSLMQANTQQRAAPPPRKEEFDGMSDDDVLTVGDFKKALTRKEKQYEMSIKELRMTQMHPDYQETVTKYLPEVLKTNPGLQRTLQDSNDYELAYYLAKNSDAYKAQHRKAEKNADAERIVQNAQRAGSLSSVGQSTAISNAKQYKTMSDDEFKKVSQVNLGYY